MPVIHKEPHPLAGKRVQLKLKGNHHQITAESVYFIEDWWDRVSGVSWMDAMGNPAALNYAMYSAITGLPTDNDVVYGKVGPFGHLIHISELGEEVKQAA